MKEVEELKQIIEKRNRDVVVIGRLLKKIKQEKSYKEKSFSEFLRNIGISTRTANYYIRISELENADKLVKEIGYTKLIVLMEAKKLNKETLEMAKEMSVSQLKRKLFETEQKKDISKVEKDIERLLKKYPVDDFKKALVNVIKKLKEEE